MKKYTETYGKLTVSMDINPEDIRIKTFHNPSVITNRQFFVTVKHEPTGIVVTECDKSQIMALSVALSELERLVLIYEV